MSFKCYFCNHNYTRKDKLYKHLENKRCKSTLPNDWVAFNNALKELDNLKNLKTNITTNPIGKWDLHYTLLDMKNLIKKYHSENELYLSLSDYIKNILCDPKHPENHSVKYIKKYPSTFNIIIQENENKVSITRVLKDAYELLIGIFLDILKYKFQEYYKTCNSNSDYSSFKKALDFKRELYDNFDNSNVKKALKKALKSVLRNDILGNPLMKLKPSE